MKYTSNTPNIHIYESKYLNIYSPREKERERLRKSRFIFIPFPPHIFHLFHPQCIDPWEKFSFKSIAFFAKQSPRTANSLYRYILSSLNDKSKTESTPPPPSSPPPPPPLPPSRLHALQDGATGGGRARSRARLSACTHPAWMDVYAPTPSRASMRNTPSSGISCRYDSLSFSPSLPYT